MNMMILEHIRLLCMFQINYFDCFDVEKLIRNRNIKTSIFRIQVNNSIMRGYFCTGFINFVFANKTLIVYTSFFSPYDLKKMTI